jgi:glucosyl-3-phosphoglycerate synthase
MITRARAWFAARTTAATDWPVEELLIRKTSCPTRISVVIPARNEAATIGAIVRRIRADLIDAAGLVDELLVIDSDSTDATAQVARRNGAQVWAAAEIRPEFGAYHGKGEAVWKSLFVATGDILVFLDGDLTEWGSHFVTGLVGPLLSQERVQLVKGFYDRQFAGDNGDAAEARPQGGRVTELVARPLLNLKWPELAAVVQPIGGEWGVRRELLASLSIPVGYGVEMAVLLDTWQHYGLDALAQVDLGIRRHRHQSVHDLGVMAAEIQHVALLRLHADPAAHAVLHQFDRAVEGGWVARPVPVQERPPVTSVSERSDSASEHRRRASTEDWNERPMSACAKRNPG